MFECLRSRDINEGEGREQSSMSFLLQQVGLSLCCSMILQSMHLGGLSLFMSAFPIYIHINVRKIVFSCGMERALLINGGHCVRELRQHETVK